MKKWLVLLMLFSPFLSADNSDGKKVFETYCWGCHHQTAVAFGPPFTEIASRRTLEEIEAYIISPESMYKAFGYKRTAMSQLNLNDKERESVAKYILSYKGK